MAYVTIHTLDGNADDLLERKQRNFDPVVRRIAPDFGGIASVTAKTDQGLLIVNVWSSAEKVPAFTKHPDLQAAQATAQLPVPSSFDRYEAAEVELFSR